MKSVKIKTILLLIISLSAQNLFSQIYGDFTNFSKTKPPKLIDTWTDEASTMDERKEYIIKYTIKEYDVGSRDDLNIKFTLWTVALPAQNFEIMLKFGALKFTQIKDCRGSKGGQTADDLLIDWHDDPSLIDTKEFVLANFKSGLYYNVQLIADDNLENKDELTDANSNNINSKGTFTDSRDGKTYKTIKIGNQIWMAENLTYNAGSSCWAYDDNSYNLNTYGYLYNWQTAKNICPYGWHLPSEQEFETLLNNYGGDWTNSAYEALIPGGTSGFSTSFGGWRDSEGIFDGIGEGGRFWSSYTGGEAGAWDLSMDSNYEEAGLNYGSKSWGFSVRCVQDN